MARSDLFVSFPLQLRAPRTLSVVYDWTLNFDRPVRRLDPAWLPFENADADRAVSDLRLILAGPSAPVA